jgi:2-iminobutanoate/2-iminopropanoate deaminase
LGPLSSMIHRLQRAFCYLTSDLTLEAATAEVSMDLINNAPAVPQAVGPYSQAARSGDLLFCSGQIPINPATGKIEATDVEAQAQQVFSNIRALLQSQGLTLNHVIKATVFLQDMADFPKVNALYEGAFGSHKPARSTVQVARLPLGALVEIEVISEAKA